MGKSKKVEPNEEVVEMGKGDDGTFHPIAIVKAEDHSVARRDAMKDMPRWYPAVYEIMDGFAIGLGAIENFMMNMRKMNRRVRK